MQDQEFEPCVTGGLGGGWTIVTDVMGVMGSMIPVALESALGDLCLSGKAD